jgi:DNA repair protein RadC
MTNLFTSQVAEVQLIYKNKVKTSERKKITMSSQAVEILKPFYDDVIEYKEVFYCLFLNQANHVLAISKISEGGLNATVVDLKMIFQYALKVNAQGIILSHNHPSGNKAISDADMKITKQIIEAGKIMQVQILDHLIITSEGYTSFQDEGVI